MIDGDLLPIVQGNSSCPCFTPLDVVGQPHAVRSAAGPREGLTNSFTLGWIRPNSLENRRDSASSFGSPDSVNSGGFYADDRSVIEDSNEDHATICVGPWRHTASRACTTMLGVLPSFLTRRVVGTSCPESSHLRGLFELDVLRSLHWKGMQRVRPRCLGNVTAHSESNCRLALFTGQMHKVAYS